MYWEVCWPFTPRNQRTCALKVSSSSSLFRRIYRESVYWNQSLGISLWNPITGNQSIETNHWESVCGNQSKISKRIPNCSLNIKLMNLQIIYMEDDVFLWTRETLRLFKLANFKQKTAGFFFVVSLNMRIDLILHILFWLWQYTSLIIVFLAVRRVITKDVYL